MEQEENGRQLKLGETDLDKKLAKKKKKKKNRFRDRKIIFFVLLMTVLASLGFYLVSGGRLDSGRTMTTKEDKGRKYVRDGKGEARGDGEGGAGDPAFGGTTNGGGFFGEAVYEF